MPMQSVILRPGVNTLRTLAANEAGVSVSQMIRYKDQLIQTNGGWVPFVSFAVGSTVRDLHPWEGVDGLARLGIGATQSLSVITSGSMQDVTPQTLTTDFAPDFSVAIGSSLITIVDPASSGVASIYGTVYFNTPVAIGSFLVNGPYKIQSAAGTTYTISASALSTQTIASSGKLPTFTTSSGSARVTVNLSNNGFLSVTGLFENFIAPTTVSGQTIQGPYQISSIIDSTTFTINLTAAASTSSAATMNSSRAEATYYIALGPSGIALGYGAGGYGAGAYGTGATTVSVSGNPITATDWTLDNWGEALVACPSGGPIYIWSPNLGVSNAQVITQAPFFNGGIFVSMPQQILVAWGSCQTTGAHDPLMVRWSDADDYTNWSITSQTAAGAFHIPTGSVIVGALQGPTQGIIWTDIDVWVMQYIGGELIFGFNRIGSGAGLIGLHAAGVLAGNVWWCSKSNFYMLGANGVQVMPCPVWDQIFQNLNSNYVNRIKCCPNSAFNEIMWEYPSALSTGENDSYVRYNIVEQEWDFGSLARTAWIDVSILGMPIGSDPSGQLWQHETGTINFGVGAPSFKTGWWAISDANELQFIDFIIPDFIWGPGGAEARASDAQIQLTVFACDYLGGPTSTYGPYTVTSATPYINCRIRARYLRLYVVSGNSEFWRLGRVRFRIAAAGRR